jgi:hypothetical protein
MATTSRASTRTSLQLPRPIEPIKPLASELRGPQTANLPLPAPTLHLFARVACSKQRRPPQPNLHSPNSRPAVQCNEGFCNARDGQRLTLTTSTASQKPHNYARGRSPTKTRYRPATSAVNKQLTASKLCTQPARAAFNPAHTVNIDLTAALSFWPARRDCRRRQQDEPKLENRERLPVSVFRKDRSENRLPG